MLFLNLENQIFLLLIICFSVLFFIGSFTIRYQPKKIRVFAMAFITPFVLNIMSFITATYNNENASFLLIISHIMLLINCSLIMLHKANAPSLGIFYVTPLILIGLGVYLSAPKIYNKLFLFFSVLILAFLVLNLVLLINNMFHKDKAQSPAYAGLFIISFAMVPWAFYGQISIEVLILLLIGYICCFVYLYTNSLKPFYNDYQTKSDTVRKMNISIQAEVIRRVEEIERSNKRLLEKSRTDSMTGLMTKSAILEKLNNSLERSPKELISVVMFDIDYFKKVNDEQGHQTGDLSIRNISNYIRTCFRQDDLSGRYGGDEFLVLLPNTSSVRAFAIAERFRETVETKSSPPVTISLGISTYPQDGNTPNQLIEAADKALYASKTKGRNCVTLYTDA